MASTGNRGMSGGMGGTETQQRPAGNFGPTSGQTQGGGTGMGGTVGAVRPSESPLAAQQSTRKQTVQPIVQGFRPTMFELPLIEPTIADSPVPLNYRPETVSTRAPPSSLAG